MPQAVESTSSLAELAERLQNLERRVAVLEGRPGPATPTQLELAGTEQTPPQTPATRRRLPLVETTAGVVPVLGKAILGIAGAYLLRAIAESGAVPRLSILLVAIVYAGLWMVWAVRTHGTSRFASITYGVTSVLILSPMLWESTVSFQVLSPVSTSVVLFAFVAMTVGLAWRRNLQVIPWVATLASVATALALIIATHDLSPFTAALLAVALVTEIAACLGHRMSLRAIPALAADFAVWLLVYVMTSLSLPEGYHAVAPFTLAVLCLSLLLIYAGSIGIRSLALRQRLTIFEIGQGVLAFGLASFGAMRASHGSAATALGVFFLLLAAVCYWGTLSRFTDQCHTRNRRVYATWAAALLSAGILILFPANLQVLFLCLAAVAAGFVYRRTRKFSLGLHTSFYLAAATAVSPFPTYAGNALAGTVPTLPDGNLWIVAASAALCYAIASQVADQGKRRLLWVVPAMLVSVTASVLGVVAIVWLATGRVELNASRLSVVRTVVNCGVALALGFLSLRWKRVELAWVAYAAVAFGTLKLLFEDLRFGNAGSLVVSLLFYGLILILLPRLTRRGQTQP